MSMPRIGSMRLHSLFKSRNSDDYDKADKSSKRSSGFFNSIRSMGRRAVSFRFSNSGSKGNNKNRLGSVLKAIQEEVALQDSLNPDVTVSSFGDLIDSNVVDEEEDIDDMLDDIDPPPTPIVVTTNNDDQAPPMKKAPEAPISPKSKMLANLPEEVMLGHVFLRHLKSSEMDLKTHCVKSKEMLRRQNESRHRVRISKSLLEAIDMSNSSDSVIDKGAPVTEIDLYESNVELVDVWRCELHIVRSTTFETVQNVESNTTRVNGLIFRCRHGIEHLYRVIKMIQTRGAILSERCNLFVDEIELLRSDEKYVKQAKRNLAQHIEQLSWGMVKNVLSKTDIAHQRRKLRREFLSREYQSRFYQRAQITPRVPVVPGKEDVSVVSPFVSGKEEKDVKENDDREVKEEKAEEKPKAMASMIDMWTSKFETLGKDHRQRLQDNIVRSSSIPDIRSRSISSSSASTTPSSSVVSSSSASTSRGHYSSVSSSVSNTSRHRKSTLGLAERRIMRMSTDIDTRHDVDSDLPIWNHSDVRNLCQKIAIFVLGPSASGKTHMTRQNLTKILKANGLSNDSSFISIDGGIMRDCSQNWRQMKRRHTREYKGFRDLFGGYFQPMVRSVRAHSVRARSARIPIILRSFI